jgi:class 3 adenylate cyclase
MVIAGIRITCSRNPDSYYNSIASPMSRIDCISNRNIKIISSYLTDRVGHFENLFLDLPYPNDRYSSPESFFLNEDEWTTLDNFHSIFRRAKEISGEAYFYFNCGLSSASLRSWGRYEYFIRVFTGPDDGFIRLPFFNNNINDTKEIEILIPPRVDKTTGKTKLVLKIEYHDDIEVEKEYIVDSYRRGLISAIPTVWGLSPATIKQPLYPYDPVKLFQLEPEVSCFDLNARMEGDFLLIDDPRNGNDRVVGKKVCLISELINGKRYFSGKYVELKDASRKISGDKRDAILITETIEGDGRILFRAGEIFKAPYFIMEITYDRISLINRLAQVFRAGSYQSVSEKYLMDTINRLRETIKARNRAYYALIQANEDLKEAKNRVMEYNITLQQRVDERTAELVKAKDDLMTLNRLLEQKVDSQVEELKRYNDLRRYLSPKLSEKILSSGSISGGQPQRKMMTVMFTDIRNFSSLTDSLEPEELFHLLDKYLSEMTTLIHRYDGTLNKIIGDGMLIFFGDPITMEDHAQRSVLTAIEMQKKAEELKAEWLHFGYELGMGIGINTGYMTVGNIGSDLHMDYTVIGNQVNVAARLESMAKSGQILISQRTYSRVRDIVDAEEIGEVKVKGIHNPVMTYNIKVS